MKKSHIIRKVLPLILTAVLGGLYFPSCNDTADVVSVFIEGETEAVFEPANTYTLHISSNGKWTLVGVPSWVKATPSSGSGDAAVELQAQPNTTGGNRIASLVISGGDVPRTFRITQLKPELSINPDPEDAYVFDADGTPLTIAVTSNTLWEVKEGDFPDWCDVSPSGGAGDGAITLTPKPLEERTVRPEATVTITHAGGGKTFAIMQFPRNEAPTKPVMVSPAGGQTGLSPFTVFQWLPSTDPDGDEVWYTFYAATDAESMVPLGPPQKTAVFIPEEGLEAGSQYYIRVDASDEFGGVARGDIISVTVGSEGKYGHGETRIYQENTAVGADGRPLAPFNVVIIVDGFVESDYVYGSYFDKIADEVAEYFFSVEPYSTYRDYFRVQKLAAYSEDRGASIGALKINTFFECSLTGSNTYISRNTTKIFDFVAEYADGVDYDALAKTVILLAVNINFRAGTCYMGDTGRSVASFAINRALPTSLRRVVIHEGGGHGGGRLADEYTRSYPDQTIPDATKNSLLRVQGLGGMLNISVNPAIEDSPWHMFKGIPGYEAVGMYEGAYNYGYGVWRSEELSIMGQDHTQMPYFNAISRYLIYKRIMEISGDELSFERFMANDHQRSDPGPYPEYSPATEHLQLAPMAPPEMGD